MPVTSRADPGNGSRMPMNAVRSFQRDTEGAWQEKGDKMLDRSPGLSGVGESEFLRIPWGHFSI